MRTALIEPNEMVGEAIGRQLGAVGIVFDRVEGALDRITLESIDAIVMGSVADPFATLADVRAARSDIPVLCLIERRSAQTVAELLYAGADDVMVKPVVGVEIRARIDLALRREAGHGANTIREGALVIHMDGSDPEVSGHRVHFSQREQAILQVLARHRGTIVGKERIYEAVYGKLDYDPLDKVIDVYICKLRKKIAEATGGARYIQTVYGRGYKLEAPRDLARDAIPVPVARPIDLPHAASIAARAVASAGIEY